jgi:hypothetical protein
MGITVLASHLVAQAGGFEPQRQNNFCVEIPSLSGDKELITLALDTAFAPVVRNEEIALPYGNEVVFAAGRAAPEPGALILRDFIDQDVLALLLNWRRDVYDERTGRIGLAADYKKTGFITMFGPDSTQDTPGVYGQRQWELVGLWPLHVNPASSGLTMNASGPVTIEMSLRFDKAFPIMQGIAQN